MENFRFLFQLFYKPTAAMSEIMDGGSLVFAAVGVLVLSFAMQFAINAPIVETFAVSRMDYVGIEGGYQFENDESQYDPEATQFVSEKKPFPIFGATIFYLFSFLSSFVTPLVVLALFYFPGTILLASLFGRLGNPGVVIRRDYGTFVACGLMAWIAAHLPFALIGLGFLRLTSNGFVFFGLWLLSGVLFGVFLLFALRTVFGLEYRQAILTLSLSWAFFSGGIFVVGAFGPWLFSPFLIILVIFYFGGHVRGEVSGIGNAMRGRRDFKRHLQNATVNPNDADAHVQLGLIYSGRRQQEKATEHFERAFEIDKEEIDANFELGKLARTGGEFQKAIEHFSVVVEQNDRYSVSEIWREIGLTYMEAGMPDEADSAFSKFVKRRAFDSEGLYHYGMLLKKQGKETEANEMFVRAVDALKSAPYHRRRDLIPWVRLARKEL